MRHLLAILCVVLGLAIAGPVPAQETPQPFDYPAFEQVADQTERLLENTNVSDARLEVVRQQLSEARSRLLAAQTANQATIDRLEGQIEALGPAPTDGATEPEEIANRRAELSEQLAQAQVPRVTATEAYNRADGLIAEIDAKIRARQNQRFLERGPSPLIPANWQDAATSLIAAGDALRREITEKIGSETTRQELRDRAVVTVGLVLLGLLLIIRGRSWAGRVATLISRRRARSTVIFLVSLGQVFLPVMGTVMLVAAVIATGIAGAKGTAILTALIAFLATTFAALWLGGRVFPVDPSQSGTLGLGDQDRAKARHFSVGIGVMVGLGVMLNELADFDEVGPAADAVLLLPFYILLGYQFWRLGKLLIRANSAAREAEETSFASRALGVVGRALVVIGIAGPIIGLAGFANAAEGVMIPTALTLGLFAFILALQVPIRDVYALISRTPLEDAGKALVPVLVNFALVVASLPVLALIWGMRWAELSEVYARFAEGFSIGDAQIRPGDVMVVLIVFIIALMVVRILQGALRSTVLPRTKMDSGAQNAIVSGIGYVGIAIAGLIAINAGGIDLTTLAFVVSALSVGIGFGLRNVIENFVAGVILLIERPIGEGDWIEVGGNMGIVKKIAVRSTTIETFDKQQLIVPNGDFITGTVTNWTRGSQVGRAVVNVGVAYGTDTRRVEQILLEIAKENPGVMRYPEPGVDFMGFGADSLDFRIRAMLYDVNQLVAVKSEIHHRIAERFTEEGIEIPFAQRDIWLRNPEALNPKGKTALAGGEEPHEVELRSETDSLEDAADSADGDDP